MLVYGRLILYGANWLSDGSELLLEILDPGIIGGTYTAALILGILSKDFTYTGLTISNLQVWSFQSLVRFLMHSSLLFLAWVVRKRKLKSR